MHQLHEQLELEAPMVRAHPSSISSEVANGTTATTQHVERIMGTPRIHQLLNDACVVILNKNPLLPFGLYEVLAVGGVRLKC